MLSEIIDMVRALEERIAVLEDENSQLRAAVEDLEVLLGATDGFQGAISADGAPARDGASAFVVEEVRRYDTAKEQARIKEIEKTIADREKSLAQKSEKLYNARNGTLSGVEANALGADISRLRREIRNLKVESAKVKREIDTPRHWLMGWDGDRDIMLLTTRDESELISTIKRGEVLHWIGEIVDAGALGATMSHYQTIVAKRIWKSAPGAQVKGRPDGRTPVWVPSAPPSGTHQSPALPSLPNPRK